LYSVRSWSFTKTWTLYPILSNQMQMVLAKEKLNLFMKGQDVDLDEVYDRFGVDYDLMSLLMSREADEDGNFKISWGEQKIS
jgi:hypothetical protein